MSRSLTPKNDERSAATSATRSDGSSIARSTASDLVHLLAVEERLAAFDREAQRRRASSASSRWRTCVSRGASTMTSPARLGRVGARLRVAHLVAAAPPRSARSAASARGLGRAAGPRPRRTAPSKRSAIDRRLLAAGPGGGAIGS